MRIGELSERTGISQRMLRYYEQEGLLKPQRTNSGYRDYSHQAETLVRHIRNLSEVGIKLNSIRTLLPCISGQEQRPKFVGCPEVRANLREYLETLDRKLSELSESRNAVAGFPNNMLPDTD